MNKAFFFDRDGTLIEEKNFISNPDEVFLLPGVKETLKALKEKGFLIIVVTNQSGIARGLLTEEDMKRVNKRLNELLDGMIDDFFYCPHHPDITGVCKCRKPEIGMIDAACEKFNLDISECFMVGDKLSDVQTGKNAGMKQSFLVMTGYGIEEYKKYSGKFEIYILNNISEILERVKRSKVKS